MRAPLLRDSAWRERVGFDNVKTIEDLLPAELRYKKMDRLDAAGYYKR